MTVCELKKFKCICLHFDMDKGYDYPIAFGYFASLLQSKGATCEIMVVTPEEVSGIQLEEIDLVVFFPLIAYLPTMFEAVKTLKKKDESILICFVNSDQHQHEMVLCGPAAEKIALAWMHSNSLIDYVLLGESEFSFMSLCEYIAGITSDINRIPSCYYRLNKKVMFTSKSVQSIFQKLPIPTWNFLDSNFKKNNKYFSVRVQSSRGCVSKCLYCAESSSNKYVQGVNPWSGKDINVFVDELYFLHKEYEIVFFNVIDSSFEDPGLLGIERVKAFCENVIARKLQVSFKVHLRTETINKFDDSFLDLMKRAGIDVIVLGIESGSDSELRSYIKIADSQGSKDALTKLDKRGDFFALTGHMMFGPFMEFEDLRIKAHFLKDIGRHWDYLNFSNNIIVYYGSAYHSKIKEAGLVLEENVSKGVISYKYKDIRIRHLAKVMSSLRHKEPYVVKLHSLLYDSFNLLSRYTNSMNLPLWELTEPIEAFKVVLSNTASEVGECYFEFFLSLINHMEDNSKSDNFSFLPFPQNKSFENTIAQYEKSGFSTDKLYLRTWLSTINKDINSSQGIIF